MLFTNRLCWKGNMHGSAAPVILVVDDELDVLAFLKLGLEHCGFIVHATASAKEAIVFYQQHPEIDLVFLDVFMPDLDGPATFQRLRQINPAVRCCLNTGLIERGTEAGWLANGIVRVFQKPFRLPELAKALHQLARDPSDKKVPRSCCLSG
jgi:CheY-like chemotaxis protein